MIRTDRLWMNVRLRDGFLTDEFEAGFSRARHCAIPSCKKWIC